MALHRRFGAFERWLALIALGGLALRLVYTILHRHYAVLGDALTFFLDAKHLAEGHGFQRAFEPVPTAEHPPVFVVLLAATRLVGAHSVLAEKLAMCFVGTVTVVLIGVLARRVAGPRAGLIAAGLAAVYPMLWLADGSLMSETPYGVTIVLVLLAAYAFLERPSARRGALVGALVALASLTRGEALWLIPLLALPLAFRAAPSWRGRAGLAAAMVAAFALTLAPWTIRNLVTFEKPILISTNSYGVWPGANCHETYYTDEIGLWHYQCYGTRPPGDESEYSLAYRDRGLRYLRDHAGRLPLVMAARLGRVWDVFRPAQGAFYEAGEGRPFSASRWGVRMFYVVALLALAGALVLRRRGRPLLVLLAPVAMVTVSAVVIYGSTRLRFAAEPSLVVLAAVALDAAVRRRVGRRRTAEEVVV